MGRVAPVATALCALFSFGAWCGCGSSGNEPEVVVEDATLGGGMPQVIGATANTVFWSSAESAASTLVGGAAVAKLPAMGAQLAASTGPVAAAGEHVVLVTNGYVSRVDTAGTIGRISAGTAEALAGSADELPMVVWTMGATVSWGVDDLQLTATLTKIDRCDHALVTASQIYVACDGASGRRLLRLDQMTGDITPVTASSTWAPSFPNGGLPGSTYVGRLIDGNDEGVLWLVEEMPSNRGIVVLAPMQGEPVVLLEHVSGASGFFASKDTLYWQEADALLSAPRTGGAASIVAHLAGNAGAFADGFIYFTDGAAIDRLRVE